MSNLVPAGDSGFGLVGLSSQGLSRSVARPVRRELDWLSGRSEIAQARDSARAQLTNAAMHNVGSLVMTGQSLMQVAPEGSAHYEALLSAYAVGAAEAIARFR